MKKITFLIVLVFFAFISVKAQLTGSGTNIDPYQIATIDELVFMRTQVNTGVTGYPAAYYKLTANVDLSTYADWSSIGSTTYPFSGTFDGSGFKITHLKTGISGTPTSTGNTGLFAVVTDATVTNLTVETDGIYATGVSNAGILAATATGAIISNCNVSGILSTASSTANYIGGLVGKANGSKIVNCMADVTLTSTASGTLNIGGLIGNLSSGTFQGTASVNSYIYNSYTKGSVYSSTVSTVSYTGGLVGNIAGGSIYNSYSSATVKGECTSGSANTYVGGIIGVGTAGLDVKNCIALNSSLICINATGNKQIGRMSGATVGTLINYDADYALDAMTVQTGTSVANLASVTLSTKAINTKQGADLGTSVPKNLLNAYVTSNTAPNGTSWLYWATTDGVNNGNPYFTSSNPTTFLYSPVEIQNYYVTKGKVIFTNCNVNVPIVIYNIKGEKLYEGKPNSDNTAIELPAGVYVTNSKSKFIVF